MTPELEYMTLTSDQKVVMNLMRALYNEIFEGIKESVPGNTVYAYEYRVKALEYLELSNMYLNKAISRSE